MKIVLVTHDSALSRFLAASLYAASAVDQILVESGRANYRWYWRKLDRVGAIEFAFQAWFATWYRREGARAIPRAPMPPHLRIQNANDFRFGPNDLVVGFGTSYVKRATLARLPNGFLNLHTGFLPQYRGVKSEFWALARRDLSRIGWTLHYMSATLDTGDIVMRRQVPWDGESPPALRAKLVIDAAAVLAELLRDARARDKPMFPRAAQGQGTYYSAPRWRDWRLYQDGCMAAPRRFI